MYFLPRECLLLTHVIILSYFIDHVLLLENKITVSSHCFIEIINKGINKKINTFVHK